MVVGAVIVGVSGCAARRSHLSVRPYPAHDSLAAVIAVRGDAPACARAAGTERLGRRDWDGAQLINYIQSMPRKARLFVPGCVHHGMARGLDGIDIFVDDADRQIFLEL